MPTGLLFFFFSSSWANAISRAHFKPSDDALHWRFLSKDDNFAFVVKKFELRAADGMTQE